MYSSNERRDGMQNLCSSLVLTLITTNRPLRAPHHPPSPRKGYHFLLGFFRGDEGEVTWDV